jgi:hypothetical protein
MATFISLTNELLRRLNEVTIPDEDFTGVRNIQALAKDAVNNAVRFIIQDAQEWPFTLTTYMQTMTTGVREYDLPTGFSSVDWDSFYLKKHASLGNKPMKLDVVSYNEYLKNYRPQDDEGAEGVPQRIYQTQDGKFGVSPTPDGSYEIEYKYFTFPDTMTTKDDVCIVPDRFSHIIIDGAMMYMMRFRSNEQSASLHRKEFEDGVKMMRRLLLDDYMTLQSTVVRR